VVLGLVVGKVIGIGGATALAVRTGLGRLPAGCSWRHMIGMSAVAGIGFTVSLFVTELAFSGPVAGEARVGILAASVLAASLGLVILRTGAARERETPARPIAAGHGG
jgi:NhaA family Na+:H+ antiporter